MAALAEICGDINNMTAITVAIDKLDKIGIDKVKEELKENNLSEEQILLIEVTLFLFIMNLNRLNF